MNKKYDLEERSFQFAKSVGIFVKTLEKNIPNNEYSKQVVRSSGSVGANYIEANESLGEKDYVMHLKISRKEAKESAMWLRLIKEVNFETAGNTSVDLLILEATELRKIFSSIILKSAPK